MGRGRHRLRRIHRPAPELVACIPPYNLPFAFTRVKPFSGINETCSQHLQETGALSGNKPSKTSQRRLYPLGLRGLFGTSLSLQLYSINIKEQHGIKWPLCCFMKGLQHVYKQLRTTQDPPTPPHRRWLPCPLLWLQNHLGMWQPPLPAQQGPACTPQGSGSTARHREQASPPLQRPQPNLHLQLLHLPPQPDSPAVHHFAQFVAFSG